MRAAIVATAMTGAGAMGGLLLASCGGTSSEVGGPGGGGAAQATGGASGAGGQGGGAGATASAGACSLTFTFTPVSNLGRYAPNNVSAVWVTSAAGVFVRTLEENGNIRQAHLTAWEQASRGSRVDAVTGATNRGFRAHEASWDCTDLGHQAVPADTYTLNAEFATDNGGPFGTQPPLLQVEVPIGGGSQTLTPPDAQYFTGVQVALQ